jgi:hypothetical protein
MLSDMRIPDKALDEFIEIYIERNSERRLVETKLPKWRSVSSRSISFWRGSH